MCGYDSCVECAPQYAALPLSCTIFFSCQSLARDAYAAWFSAPTCVEIDECLETDFSCGPYENICTDKIDDYDCACGTYGRRGLPSNPCGDHLYEDAGNTCVWSKAEYAYKCACNAPGYVGVAATFEGAEKHESRKGTSI